MNTFGILKKYLPGVTSIVIFLISLFLLMENLQQNIDSRVVFSDTTGQNISFYARNCKFSKMIAQTFPNQRIDSLAALKCNTYKIFIVWIAKNGNVYLMKMMQENIKDICSGFSVEQINLLNLSTSSSLNLFSKIQIKIDYIDKFAFIAYSATSTLIIFKIIINEECSTINFKEIERININFSENLEIDLNNKFLFYTSKNNLCFISYKSITKLSKPVCLELPDENRIKWITVNYNDKFVIWSSFDGLLYEVDYTSVTFLQLRRANLYNKTSKIQNKLYYDKESFITYDCNQQRFTSTLDKANLIKQDACIGSLDFVDPPLTRKQQTAINKKYAIYILMVCVATFLMIVTCMIFGPLELAPRGIAALHGINGAIPNGVVPNGHPPQLARRALNNPHIEPRPEQGIEMELQHLDQNQPRFNDAFEDEDEHAM